jgi:hypothetical protein
MGKRFDDASFAELPELEALNAECLPWRVSGILCAAPNPTLANDQSEIC